MISPTTLFLKGGPNAFLSTMMFFPMYRLIVLEASFESFDDRVEVQEQRELTITNADSSEPARALVWIKIVLR